MKILYFVPALAISAFLQAELLDFNPLIKIMADAPVYGTFVWLFFLQQRQNDKLISAVVKLSGKKARPEDEDE